MGEKIKELHGHSGSTVFLMKEKGQLFVRKINNVERNFERLTALQDVCRVPKIYHYGENILDMEYIHGLDMRSFLLHNRVDSLIEFLGELILKFSSRVVLKDYTPIYQERLKNFDTFGLSFSSEELIEKLPKVLPRSEYHGDLTLENILHSSTGFYLIDAVKTDYDSYVFDIAKLRQDVHCQWFLRNNYANIDVKLKTIESQVLSKFPEAQSDYLLILMLARVMVHCEKQDENFTFLKNWMEHLWTSSTTPIDFTKG